MAAKFKERKKQKGLAIVETLPILIVFIILLGYGLGFFGVVHTAILNSIASRAYTFETFRNRTNLSYLRERNPGRGDAKVLYSEIGNRVHGIRSEKSGDNLDTIATTRWLDFGQRKLASDTSQQVHNERVFEIPKRNREGIGVKASPVWVMITYGICLDAQCGDE